MNGCVCVIFILFYSFYVNTTFFSLKYEDTALHIAAYNGFEQIVKILVEHGSNVHLQDKVFSFSFFDFDFDFDFFLFDCEMECCDM